MTLETTPTALFEATGTRFAYCSLGERNGTSLIWLQHFSGTMDSWDSAVVNAVAEDRPVIVFDNTGLGRSTGTIPENATRMAADAKSSLSGFQASERRPAHPLPRRRPRSPVSISGTLRQTHRALLD